jgi:hypothetical protein
LNKIKRQIAERELDDEVETDAQTAGMVKLEGEEKLKGVGDVDAVEGRPEFFIFYFFHQRRRGTIDTVFFLDRIVTTITIVMRGITKKETHFAAKSKFVRRVWTM